MRQKDTYDHLADVYFDLPKTQAQTKKTKTKELSKLNEFYLVFVILGIVFAVWLIANFISHRPLNQNILVIQPQPIRIVYNLNNPAKYVIYSLPLRELNLKKFNSLAFSARKTDPHDSVSLAIEFSNSFKERSRVYIKNISDGWRDFHIDLDEFSQITDWSVPSSLAFILEEWNVKGKQGSVYIDEIRFIK